MPARASRLMRSSSLRCSVNFSSWYSGLNGGGIRRVAQQALLPIRFRRRGRPGGGHVASLLRAKISTFLTLPWITIISSGPARRAARRGGGGTAGARPPRTGRAAVPAGAGGPATRLRRRQPRRDRAAGCPRWPPPSGRWNCAAPVGCALAIGQRQRLGLVRAHQQGHHRSQRWTGSCRRSGWSARPRAR